MSDPFALHEKLKAQGMYDMTIEQTVDLVASLRARLAAAEAREARLVAALTVARDKFAEYCSLHLEKGTPEATAKAMTNRRLASMCATALAADPSALAQAIEGVLDTQDKGPAELLRALRKLRDAWGQR